MRLRFIDVTQRDDIHVRTLRHLSEIVPAFASRPDRRHVQSLVRAVNATPTRRRPTEGDSSHK